MESVLGVSLRFLSLGIWTFLIVALVYSPVYFFAWSVDASRARPLPILFLSTIIVSFASVYVPTALAWFLCQTVHTWGTLSRFISKRWTTTPAWRAALAIKSGPRLVYGSAFCILAAALGAWHIHFICPASEQDTAQATLPALALIPFGAIHAVSFLAHGKDRVQYPAVHMPRLQQLLDIALPAVQDGVHVWGRGGLISTMLIIFVLKSRPPLLSMAIAALTSLCFTVALSWTLRLVNILLSERLNRRGLQHIDHVVV